MGTWGLRGRWGSQGAQPGCSRIIGNYDNLSCAPWVCARWVCSIFGPVHDEGHRRATEGDSSTRQGQAPLSVTQYT